MIQCLLDLQQIQSHSRREAILDPSYGRPVGFPEACQSQYSAKYIHSPNSEHLAIPPRPVSPARFSGTRKHRQPAQEHTRRRDKPPLSQPCRGTSRKSRPPRMSRQESMKPLVPPLSASGDAVRILFPATPSAEGKHAAWHKRAISPEPDDRFGIKRFRLRGERAGPRQPNLNRLQQSLPD